MSESGIEWKDGVPVSLEYDDIYYSLESGVEESIYVFLKGNRLRERWENWSNPVFQVGELGFGTGLNFLLTADAFIQGNFSFRLRFASIDRHPISPEQIRKAIVQLGCDFKLADELIEKYPDVTRGVHRLEFLGGRIVLDLIFEDAWVGLSEWDGKVDAWYFDGFNPQKNPAMWTQEVFEGCALRSNNHCTFSTYSSAGQVRRNISAAGFEVTKTPGFSRKREMSIGVLKLKPPARTDVSVTDVIVVGGGLAGISAAWALGKRGVRVKIFEQSENWMEGASGNPVAVFMPRVVRDWVRLSRFSISAFEYFKRHFNELKSHLSSSEYFDRGVVEFEGKDKVFFGRESFAEWNEAKEASDLLGTEIDQGGWHFKSAGWVNPKAWGRMLLREVSNQVKLHFSSGVFGLRYRKETSRWYIVGDQGEVLAEAPNIVLATANDTLKFPVLSWLPIRPVKGQISLFEADARFEKIVSNRGMIIPVGGNRFYVGSTYDWKNLESTYDLNDSLKVLHEVLDLPICDTDTRDIRHWKHREGRVALRASTPDKLPLVGPVPNLGLVEPSEDQAWKRHLVEKYGEEANIPGLSLSCAYGSRGLTQSLLGAEIVASQLTGDPVPLELDLLNAIAPDRYLKKHLKREWPNAPRTGANANQSTRNSKGKQ